MSRQRADLQGLRALAVVLVIANHLRDTPSGGYVGVDVFFVISGFLITGLLLREHKNQGRVSLSQFYRRRARRLLPVASVVTVATVVTAWFMFSAGQARSTTIDAIWASLMAANWRFAATGTDYLQQSGPLSPFQHFWSLAVEEQYYLVWPILFIALAALAARQRRDVARITGVALVIIVVLSFAWAVVNTAAVPASAYFSTFTRAWELGVGGLLAIFAPLLGKLPHVARPAMAWIGIIAIVASAFVLTEVSLVPGPWAAVPVLGSALIIAAGIDCRPRYLGLLTNRVSRYIGDISYSLYLWHFPVIIFFGLVWNPASKRHFVAAVVAMTVLSVASYHLVENPVRKSEWLSPAQVKLPALVLTAAGLAVALVMSSFAVAATAPEHNLAALQSNPNAPPDEIRSVLSSGISEALDADTWPELSPSADTSRDYVSVSLGGDCFNHAELMVDKCVFGDAEGSKTAVLIGDSIAGSWMPGISAALASEDFRVLQIANSNCPFLSVDMALPVLPDQAALCNGVRDQIVSYLEKEKPELVILSDVELGIGRLASGATGAAAVEQWTEGRADIIDAISPFVGDVVNLAPDPLAINIETCAPKVQSPSACIATVSPNWIAKEKADRRAAEMTGTRFIDTRPWFCDAEDRCPAFTAGMLMRWDDMHLTSSFSQFLAPVLRESLLPPN